MATYPVQEDHAYQPIPHHHLVNKQVELPILVHRVKVACDANSLPQELKFLHNSFRKNPA
jgi:hypothetical protein